MTVQVRPDPQPGPVTGPMTGPMTGGTAGTVAGAAVAGRVRTGLVTRAADGVRLVADLVLPDRLPAPAVVVRTPYGSAGCLPEAHALAEAGFACLVQDLRGRYLSGGEFAPGADETADGHVTLDQVAAEPWCTGEVFLYGIAYEAYAAWCAAGHPAVRGVVSRQPWPPIGSPQLDEELWWRTELGSGRLVRQGLYDVTLARDPALTALITGSSLPEAWPVDVRPWPPTPSTYKAAARRVVRACRSAAVPTLHLGSWYCRSAPTTVRQAMPAGTADTVIGGWASAVTHRLWPECALDVPDGPHPFEIALTWLCGTARPPSTSSMPVVPGSAAAGPGPARCLVVGDGRWSVTDPVPPRRTGWTFAPIGGGGRIRHDPACPYLSAPHSADLAPLPERDDVVRLSAEVRDGGLCWHGSPRIVLEAVATGAAELVATLAHERPDGVVTRLSDGTVPLVPGTRRYEIRPAPLAAALPVGHRLHLELTAGRPPRHPAPPAPVEIELREVAAHLPRPRNGAFP